MDDFVGVAVLVLQLRFDRGVSLMSVQQRSFHAPCGCRDAHFISSSKQHLVSSATELLRSGVEAQSQADVASALQVFFNLGTLHAVVRDTVRTQADSVATALHNALDTRQLSAAAGGGVSGVTARAQAALWTALEESMSRLHTAAIATWHLQRVVAKKQDPLTLTTFLSVAQVGVPCPSLLPGRQVLQQARASCPCTVLAGPRGAITA